MGLQKISAVEETSASVATLWALLEDVPGWSTWGPWEHTDFERTGSPTAGALGAIRHLKIGRRVLREEITTFDPPEELGYTVLSGLPVRGYDARVRLTPLAVGTRVIWSATFVGVFPGLGPLIRRSLQPRFVDIVHRLVTAAEARTA